MPLNPENMKPVRQLDEVDFMMAYEGGELSDAEIIAGFQSLIDSGLVWNLQGSYGRTAQALIREGLCHMVH